MYSNYRLLTAVIVRLVLVIVIEQSFEVVQIKIVVTDSWIIVRYWSYYVVVKHPLVTVIGQDFGGPLPTIVVTLNCLPVKISR